MRFDKSREWYERACRVTPAGVHSNVRARAKPMPLFYAGGKGSKIFDVDGNAYIDYVLGRAPLILGHSHPHVIETVVRELQKGQLYAAQCEMEVSVAETIADIVPCAEMVRFSNSGSEAVHAAIRLARACAGRTKILRFEGHYHGWFDNIFYNLAPPLDAIGPRESPRILPNSRGQAASDADNLLLLPWNDLAAVTNLVEKRGKEIAAIIMECVTCNNGCLKPVPGFLEGVRALCDRHDIVLIFDEVITGFRLGLGGAQEYFKVTPDLATFAKAFGNGFPVSCLAGKRKLMEEFGKFTVVHAGTYNSGVVAMAAATATLDVLTADNGAIYRRLYDAGNRLMSGIADAGREAGLPVTVRGFGPLFHVGFSEGENVVDYRSYARHDIASAEAFALALHDEGIRTLSEGMWYVSAAHGDDDISQTLDAVRKAMRKVKERDRR